MLPHFPHRRILNASLQIAVEAQCPLSSIDPHANLAASPCIPRSLASHIYSCFTAMTSSCRRGAHACGGALYHMGLPFSNYVFSAMADSVPTPATPGDFGVEASFGIVFGEIIEIIGHSTTTLIIHLPVSTTAAPTDIGRQKRGTQSAKIIGSFARNKP